jgi:YD repeat-containing protein
MTLAKTLSAALAALMLASATPALAGVQYVYDSSGRLIRAIYSNGITIEYRYDAAGNRTQIVTSDTPNTAPSAVNDSASVQISSGVNIQVRSNDTDPDGNTLTITGVGAPSGGGTVSILGGGTYVRYTAPSTTGVKTFTYAISDGAGGTSTATVSVTVSSANQAPVAIADAASTTVSSVQAIFPLGNDTDANGHTLTITSVTTTTGGSAAIAPGGASVNYTAPGNPGTYTFSYTVSDGNGGTDTATVTVEVTLGEGCVPSGGNQCDLEGG